MIGICTFSTKNTTAILYDEDSKQLYTNNYEPICEGSQFASPEAAADACFDMFCNPGMDFEFLDFRKEVLNGRHV